jgi:large subunit ribosomal protein L5e
MAFVKCQKNSAYCSRYQTKYRRRREGKTDYFSRRRMVFQDKNKYDSKKYRLVVRRTCTKIICQIIYATLRGDHVMTSATSSELKQFGLTAGLTNYAASYATGLLVARRLLNLKKMDTMFEGQKKIDGTHFEVEASDDRRPFKAFLDIGLVRATTGNRAFGAMKGASDGGIFVPHEDRRFPGFTKTKQVAAANKRGKATEKESAKSNFDAKVMRDHIFGNHVQIYYDLLKKGDAAQFKKQFSGWTKCLTTSKAKNMEELYTKVHAGIRSKPAFTKKAKATKVTRKMIGKSPKMVFQDSKNRKWCRLVKGDEAEKKKVRSIVLAGIRKEYGVKH